MVVFRYPEEPEVSYIKRLVGLPGETIRIFHGDIYVKPPGGDQYLLAASRSSTNPRCRSTSTTIDISLRALLGSARLAAVAKPGRRLGTAQ